MAHRLLTGLTRMMVAPTPTGTLILDEFTAPDGTPVNGRSPAPTNIPGVTWATSGALSITSNSVTDTNFFYATVNSGKNSVVVSANAKMSEEVQIIFRYSNNSNYYFVDLERTQGTFRIYSVIAGSQTLRATANISISVNTFYEVQVSDDGNTISALFEGGNSITYTSTTLGTNTTQGFRMSGTIDNFKVIG